MENENKDKVQSTEMEMDTWNEEQFYEENIVPKLKEIMELCDSRKIPYLLHVHYRDNPECCGVGLLFNANEKKSQHNLAAISCANILKKDNGIMEQLFLKAIAEA